MPNFDLTSTTGLRVIVGHVGRDPVESFTQSGKSVAKFSLATNEKSNNGETVTTWHYVVAWEEKAESAMRLEKGQVAVVIGKEQSREYNGKTYKDINAWFVGRWLRPPDKELEEPRTRQNHAEAPEDVPF